ncbi:MAG: type II toxin-antitoxin system HicA family toxin [Planctomycetes bacterium]|nr:type II toxin-antitoxin system HicA family toxin [Planctomycetota bacterium]
MKLPGDLGGPDLARLLSTYGYVVTRQTGSHLRLTTQRNGEHHVTIPAHAALRVGTLSGIVGDVAQHLRIEKQQVMRDLFA